jgi:hypothetical protein
MKKPKAKNRPARIVAASYEVHCPHCGDPQPNPDDGAHIWTREEIEHVVQSTDGNVRTCVACDEEFLVLMP